MFAALIAIEDNVAVKDVDIKKLQKNIKNANILIHFDDAWIPDERDEKHYDNEENH